MLAMFLATLDSTIVAPALPTIGAEPRRRGVPAVDRLGVLPHLDRRDAALRQAVGHPWPAHRAVIAALALFLVGSVACAVSPNIAALIVARALQGLGGGGLMAMAQTVVADIASPRERAQYTVYISTVWAASSIAGPALGGFLAQHMSWTVIFWLNLPIGGVAFVACERLLRNLPQARRPHRLDWWGGALVIGATVALMLMLTLGGDMLPWRSPIVVGLGAAAVVLTAAFVAHLKRAPEPLIPLSIFANRVVDKASLSMFFGMFVYVAAVVYFPLYFEICLGLDPTAAGIGLIVVLGASVIGSNFTGLNLPKMRRYKVMGYIGLPAAVVALAALSALAAHLNIWGAEALILVYGLGLGTLFPTLTVSVQNAADPRDMGAATATLAFVRSLGSALGVAVFGAVIFAYGLGEKSVGAGADPAAAAAAFRAAFALMAVATAACLAFFAVMEERPLRGPVAATAAEPVV